MVGNLDLQAIRQKLEAQRAPLLERVQAEEENLRAGKGRNPDHTDLAHDYASRERGEFMLRRAREELAQVEAALARLDDGSYGRCTRCGEAIAPARLEVLPHAALCVKCQEKQETRA